MEEGGRRRKEEGWDGDEPLMEEGEGGCRKMERGGREVWGRRREEEVGGKQVEEEG